MALACEVVSEDHITRSKAARRAIADPDFHLPRENKNVLSPRRSVPIAPIVRRETAEHETGTGLKRNVVVLLGRQREIFKLGLLQPARPPVPADVWADLPKLLALAQYENVRVKISGACTMSHQPFPYDDIWQPVLRAIDAFGLDRCMWGTDWTRTIGMLTYEQGVAPFRDTKRLSESDKAALMGGTLQKVYKW